MTSHRTPKGRRFLSSSTIYAVGDLLTKCTRFLLIPYYIQVLSQSELGMLAVLQAISLACWHVFAGGLGIGLQRFYLGYGDRGGDFAATLWWSRLGLLIPCGALMAATYFAAGQTMPGFPAELVALAILSGCLRGGNNVIEASYVIRKEPVKHRTFTFFQFLTIGSLVVYLVSFRRMGIYGAVLGETIGYGAWSVVSAILITRTGRIDWRLPRWSELFRYCMPMLPHTIFMWGLASSDRFILKQHVSLEQLGIYEVGYMMAAILSVFALSMRSAWLPDFFRSADIEGGRKKYAQTATVYVSIICFALAGLTAFAPEILGIITWGNPRYADAVTVLRLVAWGLFGQSLFIGLNQPLIYAGKTGRVAAISGISLAMNLGLNLWLVPRMGIAGAAVSTVVAYAVLVALMFAATQLHTRIPWQYRKLAAAFAATFVVCAAGCWHPLDNAVFTVALRLVLLVVLVAALARILQPWSSSRSGGAVTELGGVGKPHYIRPAVSRSDN